MSFFKIRNVPDELRVAANRLTMVQWLDATARLEPPSRRPAPAADVLAVERSPLTLLVVDRPD